jgi:16S rRNA (uracil1498-N3)-methyltransferase
MTRVFLDDTAIRGDRATVCGADAHHLQTVLRLAPGDRFIVVDEMGREREATIIATEPGRVLAALGEPRWRPVEPTVGLTIYHGLPRAARYEMALRMGTELGVTAFVPVLSERSAVRLSGADVPRKLKRWQRIVTEAARQCGRERPPQVHEPMSWEQALTHFAESGWPGVMPSAGLAGSAAPALGDTVAARADEVRLSGGLALFIGPESGFDLAEEAAAQTAGITLVSMGPRILRTETAAVVAAAIGLDRLGELGARGLR